MRPAPATRPGVVGGALVAAALALLVTAPSAAAGAVPTAGGLPTAGTAPTTANVTAAPGAAWTHAGGGPTNSGYNPAEPVVNAGSVGRLRQRWTVRPAPGAEGCGRPAAAPLVVDGRVFVLDGSGVSAYAAADGRRLWHYGAGYLEATGLVVVDGVVVVTDVNCFSTSSYSSNLIGLDARTGAERWNALSSYTTDTVVAERGTVLISGFCGVCEDAQHGVDAYRVRDGALLWSRENAVLAGPVAVDGRVLLADLVNRTTTAVAVRTGAVGWSTPGRWTAHAADAERLYLSRAGELRAVDAGTGRTEWRSRRAVGALATDGRRLYVTAPRGITALQGATGRRLWTRALDAPGRPIRAGGLLYTVTGGGRPAILSPVDGERLRVGAGWTGLATHVVVAGGTLYLTGEASVRAYTP